MKVPAFLFSILMTTPIYAQSFRGLAVLDDNTAWVSGSKGYVLRTTNGAQKWDTLNPKGYERKDFRDIHAWDANTAIIMSSGDSAVILKTVDGGKSWKKVYEDNSPGVFLDAMDFYFGADFEHGIVIGDPRRISDSSLRFEILVTNDSGETWGTSLSYEATEGEALFAASGSNISLLRIPAPTAFSFYSYEFITGGSISRYFNNVRPSVLDTLPLKKGEGCGAFSYFSNSYHKIVVGGCWKDEDGRDSNCAYYDEKTKTWKLSVIPPHGYRSSISGTSDGKILICTGPGGTDISRDGGKTWKPLDIEGANVVAFSGKYLWIMHGINDLWRERIKDLKTMSEKEWEELKKEN